MVGTRSTTGIPKIHNASINQGHGAGCENPSASGHCKSITHVSSRTVSSRTTALLLHSIHTSVQGPQLSRRFTDSQLKHGSHICRSFTPGPYPIFIVLSCTPGMGCFVGVSATALDFSLRALAVPGLGLCCCCTRCCCCSCCSCRRWLSNAAAIVSGRCSNI